MIWRLELGQYDYEIRHKPGKENIASDAFSRTCATVDSTEKLQLLHDSSGHPGYTRMYHFVRARNLLYTSEETKSVCQSCTICAELKPRFFSVKGQTILLSSS